MGGYDSEKGEAGVVKSAGIEEAGRLGTKFQGRGA